MTWLKWLGIASFCAVWGFVGSVAAVWVMADVLRGEPGPVGAQGTPGPIGAPGPAGPQGEAGRNANDATLFALKSQGGSLERRLDDVEGALGRLQSQQRLESLPEPCRNVHVVTGVDVFYGNLRVDETLLCIPFTS